MLIMNLESQQQIETRKRLLDISGMSCHVCLNNIKASLGETAMGLTFLRVYRLDMVENVR